MKVLFNYLVRTNLFHYLTETAEYNKFTNDDLKLENFNGMSCEINLRYLIAYKYSGSIICKDRTDNKFSKEDKNYRFSYKIPKNYI